MDTLCMLLNHLVMFRKYICSLWLGTLIFLFALDPVWAASMDFDVGQDVSDVIISSFDNANDWSAGTIDTGTFIEGTGSLVWDHGLYSSIGMNADYPLDLSSGEYISVWVYNELAIVDERFTLLFYSSGGDYYVKIRTDFVGWKRFVFPKDVFVVNNTPAGWHDITSVRFYARGWSNTLNPDRVVRLDDFRLTRSSLDDISPRFLASFEAGSQAPDVGTEFAQSTGGGVSHPEFFSVVDNPAPSQANPSDKVLLISVSVDGYTRAEYHANRMDTQEKTYIYAWKEFFPSDFNVGVGYVWNSYGIGQWKTWPCEVCNDDYADDICGGCGGIFNDRLVSKDEIHRFRFRAEPDCNTYYMPLEKGAWHSFALEIYWTKSSNGYYRLYNNGVLAEEQEGVKTLFDSFIPGTCDIMWGMGLYMNWKMILGGATSLDYYLDDMAYFDTDDGITIDEVLEWQGSGYKNNPICPVLNFILNGS